MDPGAASKQCRRSKSNSESSLHDSLTGDALHRPEASSPRPIRVYCGFDPNTESLHLGNLLGIIVLSWFHRCGHRAVALIGGTIGRIGDPSGKSLERPQLDFASLDGKVETILATIRAILGRDTSLYSSSASFEILNNYDWWKDVKLLESLRDVAGEDA